MLFVVKNVQNFMEKIHCAVFEVSSSAILFSSPEFGCFEIEFWSFSSISGLFLESSVNSDVSRSPILGRLSLKWWLKILVPWLKLDKADTKGKRKKIVYLHTENSHQVAQWVQNLAVHTHPNITV